jgi:hypothetical protein
MDKSLLVEIFVPTLDDAGSDGDGKVGAVGTGYPVGPDLILTARHVTEPPDRHDKYPIALRWHDYPAAGPAAGWFNLAEADVIWKGPGELDAALLRCRRPPEAHAYYGILSAEAPRQNTQWYSAGFPRAARRDSIRRPANFAGSVHDMSPNWAYFEARTDDAPSVEDDWKGASGMPVCAVGSQKILGVAVEVPRFFGSRKLHVIPAKKLLDDPDFRKKIG